MTTPTSLVGAMVGHYRVQHLLGEGGMARVYAAEDANVGRQVAIKALLPELSNKQSVIQRFMNEAKAMGRIRHPGIADVFDVMMGPNGELCIIMELLHGQTLREHLWKVGPFPVPDALPLMRQLAEALAAAHAQRIIHRDLKPENIFVIPDPLGAPRIKVLDFGIAKLQDADNVKTATSAQMGTATYMAPEQFRSAKLVDHRADIYAIGCLFFEMLTGAPPFGGRNLFEQMQAHLTEPVPFERLPPNVPPNVRDLIGRMLIKDRDQRIQSLDHAVAVLSGQAPAPIQSTALVTPHGGSGSIVIALVAIVVVAIGVALAIALT